ncbi:transcriptional regulatory [Fusarium globosum]|uniref:Transcriptional regulatory n=1 Tax=Fusarium globosum TaxID=78864 RepID=A0A8H5YQX5_9HYPO|nr:transcriptional regulatory [Fusarium globosum]
MSDSQSPNWLETAPAAAPIASEQRKRSYVAAEAEQQQQQQQHQESQDEPSKVNADVFVESCITAQVSRATSQDLSGAPDLSQIDPGITNPVNEPERVAFVTGQSLSQNFVDRVRARLLVRVALRFIGEDYHLFIHQDFCQILDKVYESSRDGSGSGCGYDPLWVCKFFVVLAMGQLYSSSHTVAAQPDMNVPGTELFLTASFYSNALGPVKSAHMYSGMAVRSSTALGLHRKLPASSSLTPLEREHRRRLWWTVYIFDRSTCSKLAQPLMIQDSDINVEMPSLSQHEPEIEKVLGYPGPLIAYISLAKITGLIMSDIYSPSAKASGGKFIQNVRSILQKLKHWDADLPSHLRWNQETAILRPVASIQLHFNQSIILTTRPMLLYVFRNRNPFADHMEGEPRQISEATKSLANACIAAARTSSSILTQLFVDNALAKFGYFDAHHLFSSTLVLIRSAIMSPNSSDSDAVQTAFQLLIAMRDSGNVAAGEYSSRLVQIQRTASQLFDRADVSTGPNRGDPQDHLAGAENGNSPSMGVDPARVMLNPQGINDYDWTKFLIPSSLYSNSYDEILASGAITADPLDSPLLQAFLDYAEGGSTGGDENAIFGIDSDFML